MLSSVTINCQITKIGMNSGQSVTFVKILIQMNIRIYSYQKNDTNEYPNIFVSKK